jgi:hypothetical protein
MPLEVDERELLSAHLAYSRFRYKLSLAKMLSGANAFRITGHKLKPEDGMQQCYMPGGGRSNNSPPTATTPICC